MPATALKTVTEFPGETARQVAAFMRGFSLEAARLYSGELAALSTALPALTPVYLTALPHRSPAELVGLAAGLRGLGFVPIPHLAARNFSSRDALDDFLSQLSAQASVTRALIIAGDRDRPAGPFGGALDAIESGLLQRHGIGEIGIAGYPDGHPRMTNDTLDRLLLAKVEAAEQTGLSVHVVTQFAFDPAAILRWLDRLRALGIVQPIRIGMAGPTNLSTLLRYAQRCGVRASAQGLMRQAGLVKHLIGATAPDRLLRPLAEAFAQGRIGRVSAHFFSFGGVAATARWAAAAAAGRVVPDRAGGFAVEPP
jgi:methylenetetrahydrofolate reductase (NADPH)